MILEVRFKYRDGGRGTGGQRPKTKEQGKKVGGESTAYCLLYTANSSFNTFIS